MSYYLPSDEVLFYLENTDGTGRINFIGTYDDWNPRSWEGNFAVKIPLDGNIENALFESYGMVSRISIEAIILHEDLPSFLSSLHKKRRFKDPHGRYEVMVERAEAVKGKQVSDLDTIGLTCIVIKKL
ncbi:hypothetical protein MHB40_20460 [Lysinibacillus sp. FSL K6-0057]|uniref:hypothetical protein n=1 Tax=Lysinibacillus sp. FSL K6-0057 TaxID=2921411 RepID=UPI00315A530F